MILQSPGDVAFQILGFPVYFYGIILAFACLLAVYTAKIIYQKIYNDGKAELIWDTAPFVVICGIIGARLYYCLLNFSYFFHNPIDIFNIRGGGLSIHGGIIAGIIALWFAAKKYKLSFLRLLDVYSIGTVFAQSFGRWGNFFNNEAFGLPTDGFLKLFIPLQNRPDKFIEYDYFHPTFLYESILDFFIFVILIFVIRKYGIKIEGVTLCTYLFLYSLVRYFIEAVRVDSALNIGSFHVAQLISLGIFIFSICFFIFLFISSLKKN